MRIIAGIYLDAISEEQTAIELSVFSPLPNGYGSTATTSNSSTETSDENSTTQLSGPISVQKSKFSAKGTCRKTGALLLLRYLLIKLSNLLPNSALLCSCKVEPDFNVISRCIQTLFLHVYVHVYVNESKKNINT